MIYRLSIIGIPAFREAWHFAMKCHVGADAGIGLVHTIEVTPANTHDIAAAAQLICPDDEVVYGDSGYVGIQKRPEIKEDEHLASIKPAKTTVIC